MYEKAKNYTLVRPRLKKTMGWLFVVLGGAAMIMPLVPGAPLLIVGLELVGFRLIFMDRLLQRESIPKVPPNSISSEA
jgi:hypothetical protein